MLDLAGPPAEPSLSRGVKWSHRAALALLAFALGGLVVIVIATRHPSRSTLVAESPAIPGAPSTHTEPTAETEVEIGTEVAIGGWRVVVDDTHDVKDAGNAGTAPDQKDAVIFPGGELVLGYGAGEYVVDGPGNHLSVYGTAGDTTPYTVFVRAGAADRWLHVDANRHGFPRGVGSHHIRQQRVRHIKVRNDGTTNLFVDAIGVSSQPESAVRDRAASSRPDPIARPVATVPGREHGSRQPVSLPGSGGEADRTPANSTPLQAEVVPPNVKSAVAVHSEPQRRVDPPPSAASDSAPRLGSGQAATVQTPDDRVTATSGGAPHRGTFEPPQRIRGVRATYPKAAQVANVEGTVVIEAVIDIDGRITSPRIVKSIPLLNTAAVDAVRQWEFKPAMRDGRPVPVTVTLSVKFTLR